MLQVSTPQEARSVEFRSLLRMILVRWWLVVPTFLITFGSVVVFTLGQKPIYEATARYVVTPDVAFSDDIVTALATLSRQQEIAATYAEVAGSRTIKQSVLDQMPVSPDDKRGLDLQAKVVPGTN